MPALSPTMTHGSIARWRVKEGDVVNAGDSVAEIETDKATMEFESQEDGVMAKICVPDGAADIPVGRVVAVMVEDAADIAAFSDYVPPAAAAAASASSPAPSSETSSRGVSDPSARREDTSGGRMWPSVRRLLAESGIDPLTITPTGPRGALVKGDVLAAMGLCAPPASSLPPTPPAASAKGRDAPAVGDKPAETRPSAGVGHVETHDPDAFDDSPVTSVRRVIASRLLESKTTNPHAFVTADVSLAGVNALRARLKAAGVRASVNDCVVYAVSRALAASPKVNATWDDAAVGYRHFLASRRVASLFPRLPLVAPVRVRRKKARPSFPPHGG